MPERDNKQQPRMTIVEARASAEDWQGQLEDHQHEAAIQARFSDVSAGKLLDMWDSRRNEHGKRLSKFEAEALACALDKAFGCVPGAVRGDKQEREQDPQADTMLPMAEVIRLTSLSKSTIKRYVEAGVFPKPLHPTPRRIAWQASEVQAWVERLKELRKQERRY